MRNRQKGFGGLVVLIAIGFIVLLGAGSFLLTKEEKGDSSIDNQIDKIEQAEDAKEILEEKNAGVEGLSNNHVSENNASDESKKTESEPVGQQTELDTEYLINHEAGFAFNPPEGWKLWHGLSIVEDNFFRGNGTRTDFEFADSWNRDTSQSLVFTRLDTDLSYMAALTIDDRDAELNDTPDVFRIYLNITAFLGQSYENYKDTSIAGKNAFVHSIVTGLDIKDGTFRLLDVIIPLDGSNFISISKLFDASNEDYMKEMEEILRGLKIQ